MKKNLTQRSYPGKASQGVELKGDPRKVINFVPSPCPNPDVDRGLMPWTLFSG